MQRLRGLKGMNYAPEGHDQGKYAPGKHELREYIDPIIDLAKAPEGIQFFLKNEIIKIISETEKDVGWIEDAYNKLRGYSRMSIDIMVMEHKLKQIQDQINKFDRCWWEEVDNLENKINYLLSWFVECSNKNLTIDN